MCLFFSYAIRAEGTKQIQPTPLSYGRLQLMPYVTEFAIYNSAPEHRLHISICNIGEKIYFGFGYVRDYDGTIQNDVVYRIKDPNGTVVVGPASIPTSGAGFIPNYNQAFYGPNTMNASGYNPMLYTPLMTGDYYIEFSFSQPYGTERKIFDFFDITVASASIQPIDGRLWSKNWQLTTNPQSGSASPYMDGFDGKMFVYSDDGVVTSVDLNNMQPFVFNISANQSGCFNTGNFAQDRKSVDGNNTYAQYKIFLNNPDESCFPTGFFGSITNPSTITGCLGQFCINIFVDKQGRVEVMLNLNGIPGYQSNSEDLAFGIDVYPGLNCIPWNGLDGLGQIIASGTQLALEVNYFNGLTHLPLYDVEANPHGFIVEIIRPVSLNPNPRLFWDDSDIIGGGTNYLGCVSATGCHPWNIGSCLTQPVPQNCSLGDMTTINTWWYANSITDTALINFEYPSANANMATPPGMNDTTVCSYTSEIQLNGGVYFANSGIWSGGSGTYSPSVNVLNPIYSFTQQDKNNGFVKLFLNTVGGNCATVADTMTITFNTPLLSLTSDQLICMGDDVQLTASGMDTYQWSPPSALSSTNMANTTASPQATTTYTVTGTDLYTCTASAQVVITVMDIPDISFTADPLNGCKPLKVEFTPFSSHPLISYIWQFGDPLSGFANSSQYSGPIHQYNTPGTYSISLTVTNTAGCANSVTYTDLITVFPQPLSTFQYSPREGDKDNMLFTFIDESVDAVAWFWDFGDTDAGADNTSSFQNPQHTYSNTGFYDIWQYVTSDHGCKDSSSREIIIRGEYTVFVPNAFTPDGDGINDYFMPKGVEINNNAFVMYIFNRWGELVFYTDDVNYGWDGKLKDTGHDAPQDVYVWIFWQENYIIGSQKFSGHVTLIR